MRLTSVLLAGLMAAATPAAAEVVYNRGIIAHFSSFDAHKTSTITEAHVMRDLLEGLTIYNAGGEIVPGAAESWTMSPDGKTYTFKLRQNGKWSNGDPVKSSDFVFSLRRIMDPATGAKYATVLKPILNAEAVNSGKMKPEELGVKAIDDFTLEIKLENATPYFLELLTHQTGAPLHEASVTKLGPDFVKPGNFVSNGAYMLSTHVPNDHTKIVKNPNFYDAANVKIDTVMFYPIEERTSGVNRFKTGELHSYDDIPADQVTQLRQALGDQVRIKPWLGVYYITIDVRRPPFSDVRVRNALSMVIDRELLAEKIWSGTMVPAFSFVPDGIANYADGAAVSWKDDPMLDREDAAKKLLAEAGFTPEKPLKVTIKYNTGENHKNSVTSVANDWKKIGVEANLVNVDSVTHFNDLKSGAEYDVARVGWLADYNDPQNFLFLGEANNGQNYSHWTDPKFEDLMKRAAATIDLEARAKILHDAEAVYMAAQPVMPLMFYTSKNLVSPKLKGYEDNLRDAHPSRFMSITP